MNDTRSTEPETIGFYPRDDLVCTHAFSTFIREYRSHLDYFFFVVRLVSRADKTRVVAANALVEGEKDPNKRAQLLKSASSPDATLNELKTYSTVTSQNLTNGIVNAFQRYFSSVIQSAAQKQPLVMTSSQDHVKVD